MTARRLTYSSSRSGYTLVEVLAQFKPAPMPVSVLYPHHRQLSPRVRVFVDWVADVMGRAR